MSDYLIAAGCIFGPALFWWCGWVARERRYEREWNQIKKTKSISSLPLDFFEH